MWQGDDTRRASGVLWFKDSGEQYEFASINFFTCHRQTHPDEGEWEISVHDGWDRINNPNVFVPFAPLAVFRENPQPRWVTEYVNDREVAVAHPPTNAGVLGNVERFLVFDKDPIMLVKLIQIVDGGSGGVVTG